MIDCQYLIVGENSIPICKFYGCPCEAVKDCDEKEEEQKNATN